MSDKSQNMPIESSYSLFIIKFILSICLLLLNAKSSEAQFDPCPKTCTCDNQHVVCNEYTGVSGFPHIYHGNTKSVVMTNGQTSQLNGFGYLEQLEFLDMTRNRITEVDLKHLTTSLVHLNISHNQINHIEDSIAPELPNLKYKDHKIQLSILDISHNNLTQIRNHPFSRLRQLKFLDLSHNTISILDDEVFGGLSKLETLNLKSNSLKQLPTNALSSLADSSNSGFLSSAKKSRLKFLDLSINEFSTIESNAFSQLDHLIELKLVSCQITKIHDEAFVGLENLLHLDLSWNAISNIPSGSFEPLGSLKTLYMNYNNLSYVLLDSFSHLSKLEELYMNNASILQVHRGAFNGNYYLKILEMSHNNNLTTIDKGTFEGLDSLLYLNLYNNAIVTLFDDASISGSLSLLDLRNNRLHCDCDLKWLTKWLIRLNQTEAQEIEYKIRSARHSRKLSSPEPLIRVPRIEDYLNLTCVTPVALSRKRIIELPQNNLECLEPNSKLNVRLGFAFLYFMLFIMISVSLINYCRYQRHLFVMLKQGIVHHHHLNSMTPNC